MRYGNIPQNRDRVYIAAFKDINDYNNFTELGGESNLHVK